MFQYVCFFLGGGDYTQENQIVLVVARRKLRNVFCVQIKGLSRFSHMRFIIPVYRAYL